MLAVQVYSNPCKINGLVAVGCLIMGLNMELIIMDVLRERYVTRITSTEKFWLRLSFIIGAFMKRQ
ncbi:MAG: hypothetical protein EXX96DRAFT_583574 [Benjaminiella poitrasii]|nr:MAG: hypothetical protein EXX96DRAFT_583574 [Benjaminiella poitrasii]